MSVSEPTIWCPETRAVCEEPNCRRDGLCNRDPSKHVITSEDDLIHEAVMRTWRRQG